MSTGVIILIIIFSILIVIAYKKLGGYKQIIEDYKK